MKNKVLICAMMLVTAGAFAQNKDNKFGVTAGAFIQHYNGNLGNSFFQFKTTCFGGGIVGAGYYINKSFDANISVSLGDYGYCQTEEDQSRLIKESQRCPGCKDLLGMGELRSRMLSGNIGIKYKFANDCILKENSKLAPYVYAGMGINHLEDNMKKNCVAIGNHYSINSGVGVTYNITSRFNMGLNLGFGCFAFKKVYYTNQVAASLVTEAKDAEDIRMEKRKDLYMQNTIFFGFNF